jgi:hypothetical protein
LIQRELSFEKKLSVGHVLASSLSAQAEVHSKGTQIGGAEVTKPWHISWHSVPTFFPWQCSRPVILHPFVAHAFIEAINCSTNHIKDDHMMTTSLFYTKFALKLAKLTTVARAI